MVKRQLFKGGGDTQVSKEIQNMGVYLKFTGDIKLIFSDLYNKAFILFTDLLKIFPELLKPLVGLVNAVVGLVNALAQERNFMPFIAFIMCIGILIAVIIGAVSASKNKKQPKNVIEPPSVSMFNPFKSTGTFDISAFFRNFTPRINTAALPSVFTGKPAPKPIDRTLTDRRKIAGRCDNLKNLEITEGNMCFHTSTPEPIVWTLDNNNMPEIDELSEMTKQRLAINAEKYMVTIPWSTYDDGFYYFPDCSRATFANGEPAAYLFTDNGKISCDKKIVNRTINGNKTRPIYESTKYTTLDGYLS